MPETPQEKNKALLLEGFDVLFNQRDFEAAKRYWSPNYIQHSAHIAPGRDGLFNLVKDSRPTPKYEHGVIMGEGDYVMAHGRYSNPDDSAIVVVASCASRTAYFRNTGMSSRMRPPRNNQRVGCPCLATSFQKERIGVRSQSER